MFLKLQILQARKYFLNISKPAGIFSKSFLLIFNNVMQESFIALECVYFSLKWMGRAYTEQQSLRKGFDKD